MVIGVFEGSAQSSEQNQVNKFKNKNAQIFVGPWQVPGCFTDRKFCFAVRR